MSGQLFIPPRKHYCNHPMVPYTVTPPPFDELDKPEPTTYYDLPPAGTVWQCPECGACWKVYPPEYANVFLNRWKRCSRWAYRRGVRKANASTSLRV